MSSYKKIASLTVKNGEFRDKNGNTKTRWHEVGVLLATPHMSNMFIKMHATADGDGKIVNVKYDDGFSPKDLFSEEKTESSESVPENSGNSKGDYFKERLRKMREDSGNSEIDEAKPITAEEIPF